jgi:hypothetical protein
MSFRQFVSDQVLIADGKSLGIRVQIGSDRVSIGRTGGRLTGAQASVSTGAPQGTLTRSVLQRGWQRRGQISITIITTDGVEMISSVKNGHKARDWVARFNTRSGAHRQG